MSVLDRMRRSGSSETHESETSQDTPPRLPAYQGCLQGIGNGNVLGWCWDPRMPEREVPIAIAVDGEIVAEGTTDIDRPDLAEVGEGARGFLIALPKSLQSPGRHRVLVLAGAERVPLEAAPSFWLDAGSGGGWSDVVFEPGDLLPSETPSAQVPEPPAEADPNAVISDGWLFDAREFDPHPNPTPADLDARVSTLTATAEACAAVGLRYVPVIAPTKRAVLGAAPALDRRWMVQLRARLRDVDGVEVLDLLPILRDGARHGTTYHRTDSDWNDRGAFFVARALIKEARKWVPTLRPLALDDLHLCPVTGYRGTLADAPRFELSDGELLPSQSTVEAEDGVIIDASRLRALRMPIESHLAEAASTHIRVYANPEVEEDARMAIVGGSACLALVPWLAECTCRTTFFWSNALPLHELELELPPVVFHLIREADLLTDFATLTLDTASLENTSSPPARELPDRDAPVASPPSVPASSAASTNPVVLHRIGSSAEPTTPPAPPAPPAKPPVSPPHIPVLAADGANGNGSRPVERDESETVTHISAPERLDRIGPLLLLGGGLLACALLLMLISRHLSFYADDWVFILHRRSWNPSVFLDPHNGHLMLIPAAIYKILFVTVGLTHYWPYLLAVVAIHLLCVGLLYKLAAKRAHPWVALIPCGLLLLPGAAYEDLLWMASIGFIASVTAGLGALLCLERRDRHGDIAATLLLCASLASTSVGIAVTAGVLVMLLSNQSRRSRVWVAIIPLVLYGLWYLSYGAHESQLVWSNLPNVPGYLTQIGAYSFAAFGNLNLAFGEILLAAGVCWLVVHTWRGHTLAPLTQVGIVGALVFWSLAAMARGQLGEPGASRYVYSSMVFLLLCLIPYLRYIRIPSARAGALLSVGIALILLSNLQPIIKYAHYRSGYDTEYNAELGAELIADNKTDPYVQATNQLGSPALSAQQIMELSEHTRLAADGVILRIENPLLRTPTSTDLATATAPEISGYGGVKVGEALVKGASSTCKRLTPVEPGGYGEVLVAPDHTLYLELNGTGTADVYARRLANTFVGVPLLHTLVSAGSPAVIPFPRDRSSLPWHVRLVPTIPTTVCTGSLKPPPAVPITPTATSATSLAAPTASQGFRADTHRLPWLYEGQKLLSPQQILSLPEADRELADTALLGAEDLPLEPPSAKALQTAVPAVLVSHSSQMRVTRTPIVGASHGCTLLTPSTPRDLAVVSVAPGHGLYLSMPTTGQVSLYAHRYANRFSTKLLHLLKSAGAPAIARFPADASTQPWQVELVPTTPTAVCLV
jgi:SGNH hydrolase-like domain, acetyltransferase AlgX